MIVYSIGHSTRSIERFIELLRECGVRVVWDIRRYPGSRREPQFGSLALRRSLETAGIGYEHHPALGGRRRAAKNGPPSAWRSASFRAYAEYMTTSEFRSALDALFEAASKQPVAIMCAEAVPWRCHRNLVSDALTARGVEVRHILDRETIRHTLTPFAVVRGVDVSYPAASSDQADLAL